MKDKKPWTDTWWGVGSVLAALFLLMGSLIYTMFKKEQESSARYKVQMEEYQKNRIVFGDYVKLTRLQCDEVRKVYDPKYLTGLSDFDRRMVMCGEVEANFHLRRSLIRYKRTMYMVYVDLVEGDTPSKVSKYNVPYCVVATDISEMAVAEPCERIE